MKMSKSPTDQKQMATVTEKEKTPQDDFGTAVSGLLKTLKNTHEVTQNKSVLSFASSESNWSICNGKFRTTFISVNKPDNFKPIFRTFYNEFRADLIVPILDDGAVCDDWLKDQKIINMPWMKKSGKKSTRIRSDDDFSWSTETNLKGVVIYFDKSDEKMKRIAIPLTEAYCCAVKHFKKESTKKEAVYISLPASILFHLYACVYHVAKKDDKEAIKANMISMKEIVDSLTPEGSNDKEGSTLNPMKDLVRGLAKTMGGGVDSEKISGMLTSMFSEEASKKMSEIVKNVSEKVGNISGKDGNTDITAMMSSVGKILMEPTAQDLLRSTIEEAGKLNDSIPTAESAAANMTSAGITPTTDDAPICGAGIAKESVDPSLLD
jgi:hypothetical protein